MELSSGAWSTGDLFQSLEVTHCLYALTRHVNLETTPDVMRALIEDCHPTYEYHSSFGDLAIRTLRKRHVKSSSMMDTLLGLRLQPKGGDLIHACDVREISQRRMKKLAKRGVSCFEYISTINGKRRFCWVRVMSCWVTM
jgi:hypothetical protein